MTSKQNEVHILFEGYSHTDEDPTATRANCTCTLIRTRRGRNVIVDTMTAWDGQRLVDALKGHDLQPSDIHHVVCTHGHADHIGCNYLFSNAEWHVVGTCISNHDKFLEWNFAESPFQLDGEDVQVIATPGHTLSCVSVIVQDTNLAPVVGICGDLFEKMEDIDDATLWTQAGSENPQAQRNNRLMMAERCLYIIPGHGPGFKITESKRVQLWRDTQYRKTPQMLLKN